MQCNYVISNSHTSANINFQINPNYKFIYIFIIIIYVIVLIKEADAQDEITQWIEALMSSKRLKVSLNYTSLELEEESEYEKSEEY